jgi:hypothetical protein
MIGKVIIALTAAALVGGTVGASAQPRGDRVGEHGFGETQMQQGFASVRGYRPGFAHRDLGVAGYGCTTYPDYGLHVPHFC